MDWLRDHPEVKTIRVAAADLNGVARGKRIPARFADKLLTEGTKFPYSVLNMDIWGEDVENSPLVWQAGDPDGLLMPTERGFMPMPWLDAPTALLPLWMFHPDGRPYDGCPRQALARAGMGIEDVDLVEINEAFAAQVLPSADDLGVDPERLNVHSGRSPWGTRSG